MAKTLEQQRAAHAWTAAEHYQRDELNIAKGLPALIMNSGLMQVLAFCNQKGGAHDTVSRQLRGWLAERFPKTLPDAGFEAVMTRLMNLDNPRDYQAITTEAFAWLKWLRQMAAARVKTEA